MQAQLSVCFLSIAAAFSSAYFVVKARGISNYDARRIGSRIGVYATGVVAWPLLVLAICPLCVQGRPLCLLSALLVMLVLEEEATALARYSGPMKDYDPMEDTHKRSLHIAASSFAAAAFIGSYKQENLTKEAAPMIILAMALSILASVPSNLLMHKRKQNEVFEAVYKLASSYSIGLLFTALMFVLESILTSRA
jgi:hypothetical protein